MKGILTIGSGLFDRVGGWVRGLPHSRTRNVTGLPKSLGKALSFSFDGLCKADCYFHFLGKEILSPKR